MSDTLTQLKEILKNNPEEFNKLPEETRKALFAQMGIKDQGLLAKTKRLFTGEGRKEFDYPDFDPGMLYPEEDAQLPTSIGGFPTGAPGKPRDLRALFYNSAVTPEAQRDILTNYRPEIAETMKQDSYGNPYVMVGDKPYYLNRPGVSGQDLRELSAAGLSIIPAARGLKPMLAAESGLARAGGATLAGAAGSVTQDMLAQQGGSKQGISAERGLLSGALSGATMLAWPLIRAVGVTAFQKAFSKPLASNGEFTTEALEIFRKAGVDPSVFDKASRVQIADLLKKATSPEEMAAVLEAKNLPVQVNLTKGQASGDRAQQAIEFQMRDNLMGDVAKNSMDKFDEEAKGAIAQNIQGVRQRVEGVSNPITELNEGVAKAQNQLITEREALKAKYKQSYKDIDKFTDQQLAWVETPERFRETLMSMPEVRANLDLHPKLKSVIDDFEKNVLGNKLDETGTWVSGGNKTPTVNELYDWRRRLTAVVAGATPEERVVLGPVKSKFDAFMKDTVSDGLIKGDPALVDMWKKAISERAEFGKLFQDKDIIERITVPSENGLKLAMDPHDAGNLIFGASSTGFISKLGIVKTMQQLKNRLSPDNWNALRSDALYRMLGMTKEQLEEIATGGGTKLPTGAAFKKSINDFETKNGPLFRMMFDEGDRKLLKHISNVWARVTMPKPGASNAAGSGLWMAQTAQRALNGPVGSLFREFLALASPTTKTIIQPVKGAFKAAKATNYGEGYVPGNRALRPPAYPTAPAAGNIEQRLLEKYDE